jgi:hypothetical protein
VFGFQSQRFQDAPIAAAIGPTFFGRRRRFLAQTRQIVEKGELMSELALWLKFILEALKALLKHFEKRKSRPRNGRDDQLSS